MQTVLQRFSATELKTIRPPWRCTCRRYARVQKTTTLRVRSRTRIDAEPLIMQTALRRLSATKTMTMRPLRPFFSCLLLSWYSDCVQWVCTSSVCTGNKTMLTIEHVLDVVWGFPAQLRKCRNTGPTTRVTLLGLISKRINQCPLLVRPRIMA